MRLVVRMSASRGKHSLYKSYIFSIGIRQENFLISKYNSFLILTEVNKHAHLSQYSKMYQNLNSLFMFSDAL